MKYRYITLSIITTIPNTYIHSSIAVRIPSIHVRLNFIYFPFYLKYICTALSISTAISNKNIKNVATARTGPIHVKIVFIYSPLLFKM